MILASVLTCPHCGATHTLTMPTDFCQYFFDCPSCALLIRSKPGDCCVFCSWATVPCPSKQGGSDHLDPTSCCR